MSDTNKKSVSKTPSSFNFYVLPGEALAYPASTHTPTRAAYDVYVNSKQVDPVVLKAWFTRSLEPLVGKEAADILMKQLKLGKRAEKAFVVAALKFRSRFFK